MKEEVTFDFVVNDPGMTLFHCHQQLHMDFGFMTLLSTYEFGEQADFAFENKGVVIGGFVSAQLHSSEQQGLVVLSKYVLAWGRPVSGGGRQRGCEIPLIGRLSHLLSRTGGACA